MDEIYGLPRLPLTGNETVTISQMQNGRLALCTMPLSALAPLFTGGGVPTFAWAEILSDEPSPSGKTFWLNSGVLTFS